VLAANHALSAVSQRYQVPVKIKSHCLLCRFLSQASRTAYARATLAGYRGLFADGHMDRLVLAALKARSIPELLAMKQQLVL
jgi:hypothetical protein